ncbi:MAG: hypothetical protein PHW75_01295 [Patescibacteria group bacterium]|nr:hypothetical protein [Patescibacteria group bacterium]
MNDEKWHDLKERAKEKFSDLEVTEEIETREDDTGKKITTKIEKLQFTSPLGELRVERATRPKILDKKTHYHHGAGGQQADIEYVLSEDEEVHKITIFKKNETGEWEEMDLPAERISF